jgi:hypothetical protein
VAEAVAPLVTQAQQAVVEELLMVGLQCKILQLLVQVVQVEDFKVLQELLAEEHSMDF